MNLSVDIGTLTKQIRERFLHSETTAKFTPQTVDRDWRRLVIVSFTLFLTLIIVSSIIFIRIRKGEGVGGETATTTDPVAVFDPKEISLWADRMISRQEQQAELNLGAFSERNDDEEESIIATSSASTTLSTPTSGTSSQSQSLSEEQ